MVNPISSQSPTPPQQVQSNPPKTSNLKQSILYQLAYQLALQLMRNLRKDEQKQKADSNES